MNAISIVFYLFACVAVFGAINLLITRSIFHGALWLIVSLLSLAILYIVALAELVAVTQILIYAGGVMVLIIFGIMLTSKISGKPMVVENQYGFRGILLGLSLFTILSILIYQSKFISTPISESDQALTSMNTMGILLMSDYSLPFEVTGILLLIALIGAAVVASSVHLKKK